MNAVTQFLSNLPRIIKGLLFAAAWVGVWGLGHLGEFSEHASIWYPPAAMTFAAMVVVGWRALPYLVIANLGGTWWSFDIYEVSGPWPMLVGFALANSVAHIGCYGLGASTLRLVASRKHHSLPMIVIAFLIIATTASAMATVGVISSLVLFNLLPVTEAARTAMAFWIGDFVAVVVLGPLVAGLLLKLVRQPGFWIEPLEQVRKDHITASVTIKLAIIAIVVIGAMLIADRFQTVEGVFLIFFMLIPQMWLTYTESPLRTALSLAAISFLIVLGLAAWNLSVFVFVYQFAIAIVATTAYFGLAIPLLVSDNQRLRRRLLFDPLTGAASRSFLTEQARLELRRSSPTQSSCLIVIDLDNFKEINDKFGHPVGDKALIALTKTLRHGTRGTDIVARFGGDEFVVLLPGTDLNLAKEMLASLLGEIREIASINGHRITCSAGLAEAKAGEQFEEWFQRADDALFKAKRAGRDQWHLAKPSLSTQVA